MAKLRFRLTGCLIAALAGIAIAAAPPVVEFNPVRHRPDAAAASIQRVIVKVRDATQTAKVNGSVTTASRMLAVAARNKLELKQQRAIAKNLQVVEFAARDAHDNMQTVLDRLRDDPDVVYAEPDRAVYAHAVPNDPLAPAQWFLGAAQPSAINATAAWDNTTGSNGVVIAVLDTGVRFDHPDLVRAGLGGRLLPGYDFISGNSDGTFFTANDGNGRDADPSDPGDWVATTETRTGCSSDNSSWHGTRTAGIIGAATNNSLGVAGIAWGGWLLPVRVLGKCGGLTSDILAAMLWSGGLHVDGVPDNPYPAQIINMSLGSQGNCSNASADVVRTLNSLGVLVVVSAGNEGGPVDSPANCPGAAAVAGLRHIGTKVGFSSLGPEIALSAPGGNCVNINGGPCLFSIDTTSNNGTTTPGTDVFTNQTNFNVGTSFSAPIVAGIGALMLTVNGNLKSAQLIARLREGATKPFPVSTDAAILQCHIPTGAGDVQSTECSCTTDTCGAGMANASGAVTAALRPIAAIAVTSSISPGGNVTLLGSGSAAACGRSIASYAWTVVAPTTAPPGIAGANTTTAVIAAPTTGTIIVRLTVTDNAGRQDSADLSLTSSSSSSTAPNAAGTTACRAVINVPRQAPIPIVSVTATDASAAEPGADTGSFTLTRSGDVAAALAVTVSIGGSATPGTDYQSLQAIVNFGGGQGSATVAVTPLDDTTVENAETVSLTIVDEVAYDLGSSSTATVSIADNDTAPPPPPPTPASTSGGGGGGVLTLLDLLILLVMLTAMSPRQTLLQQQPAPND